MILDLISDEICSRSQFDQTSINVHFDDVSDVS